MVARIIGTKPAVREAGLIIRQALCTSTVKINTGGTVINANQSDVATAR